MQSKTLFSLNPCCNGIYLIMKSQAGIQILSLNPCCNGIYLIILKLTDKCFNGAECLNPCCNGIYLIMVGKKSFYLVPVGS